MNKMKIFSIGKIENNENQVCVKLDSKYAKGLKGLQGFSHIQILWWADKAERKILSEVKPYKKGPETLGVFAMRSPERPNPIAVSNIDVAYLDEKNGIIGLYYYVYLVYIFSYFVIRASGSTVVRTPLLL